MERKLALITGANSGMGKASAAAFAKMGSDVIMLCRDKERGEAALSEVRQDNPEQVNIRMMLCDLGNLNTIRQCCNQIKQEYTHIDILLNNAGVITLSRQETSDGLELQFGVNHIGHFFLTTELLPLFHSGSRIINVGSGAHKIGRINFQNLSMTKGYSVISSYARAKLCNLLFTRELARKLKSRRIAVNCVHPGAVATNIGVDRKTGFGKTIMHVLKLFFQTPEQGAATAIYAATSPACKNITGAYLYKKKPVKSSKRSKDQILAANLWTASEKIVETFRDKTI